MNIPSKKMKLLHNLTFNKPDNGANSVDQQILTYIFHNSNPDEAESLFYFRKISVIYVPKLAHLQENI